ncbi:ArsD-related vicinal cysteine protein VcpD [Chengkuizengella axinellae]|uniref:Uncharacterized protein n=1 Tax=Chengkuizengella axinellae TaxID=3064388 RepID=A0ABT9J2U5_9BACL|nr:hypothetical protein [Chengkuizengella sp. 2205SS18-9]MDP5275947.1 hypothetical protein [Chengkuizengella sp. 2205SS18-9]
MSQNNLIEIFPSVANNQEDCCQEGGASENCYDDSYDFYEESLDLKEELSVYIDENVDIHLYNYNLLMDRIIAKKKLTNLIHDRGFESITGDHVLQLVTPAVVVNGNLISFATKPQMELVLQQFNH